MVDALNAQAGNHVRVPSSKSRQIRMYKPAMLSNGRLGKSVRVSCSLGAFARQKDSTWIVVFLDHWMFNMQRVCDE